MYDHAGSVPITFMERNSFAIVGLDPLVQLDCTDSTLLKQHFDMDHPRHWKSFGMCKNILSGSKHIQSYQGLPLGFHRDGFAVLSELPCFAENRFR